MRGASICWAAGMAGVRTVAVGSLGFLAMVATAQAQSLLERYDGATIYFTTVSCSPNSPCSTQRTTASISKAGIAMPEHQTMRDRVVYPTKYGSFVYSITSNTIVFEARYGKRLARPEFHWMDPAVSYPLSLISWVK